MELYNRYKLGVYGIDIAKKNLLAVISFEKICTLDLDLNILNMTIHISLLNNIRDNIYKITHNVLLGHLILWLI